MYVCVCTCAQANIYTCGSHRSPGLQPSHLKPPLQVCLLLNFECMRVQVCVYSRNRAGYFLGEAAALCCCTRSSISLHSHPTCLMVLQMGKLRSGQVEGKGTSLESLWMQEVTSPSPPPSQPCHLSEFCWRGISSMCSQPQQRGQKQRQGWAERCGAAKRLLVSYHSVSSRVN